MIVPFMTTDHDQCDQDNLNITDELRYEIGHRDALYVSKMKLMTILRIKLPNC